MPVWPDIHEPELLARFALTDEGFGAATAAGVLQVPSRPYDEAVLERAIGYPWWRPAQSYVLSDGSVRLLDDTAPDEREGLLGKFVAPEDPESRIRVLAFGSNASPDTLTQKFAHFPDVDDRTVLVLAGQLNEFDVGAAAQPTVMYGSMPATLFPSPGTAVRAAVLFVTPMQFTQLAWSELTYRLGWLETSFVADESEINLRGALVFVSRFGAFCIDGAPVALDFIPASGRSARALTQEELLDVAAQTSIGPGAHAEHLVRAIFEEPAEAFRVLAPIRAAGEPFRSDRFTLFPARGAAEKPRA
jgi:hypothetical protein